MSPSARSSNALSVGGLSPSAPVTVPTMLSLVIVTLPVTLALALSLTKICLDAEILLVKNVWELGL